MRLDVHWYGPSSKVIATVFGTVQPVTRVPYGNSVPPVGGGVDVDVGAAVVGWVVGVVGAAVVPVDLRH